MEFIWRRAGSDHPRLERRKSAIEARLDGREGRAGNRRNLFQRKVFVEAQYQNFAMQRIEAQQSFGDTLAVWDTGVSRRWLLVPAEAEGPDRYLVATRQRGGPDGEGPGGPFMESLGDLSLLGHIQPARQVDGAGPAVRALYL